MRGVRKGLRARYIVAHDGRSHTLLEDGELVYEGDTIVYVGPRYPGDDVTEWWDAGEALVTPGFINLHTHPISTPLNRSLREEEKPGRYSGLPFWIRLYELTDRGVERALSRHAVWELLRRGSTTALLMTCSYPEEVAEAAAELGLRAYISPSYREATWELDGSSKRRYRWDPERGRRRLDRTLEFHASYHGRANGRIQVVLGPEQVDTCSPALLEKTAVLAAELDVRVTTHAGQSEAEFEHLVETYGLTPVELLRQTGLLSPRLVIAHCIHLSHHSLHRTPSRDDLKLLSESGASVAHCPWVFARRGVVMESLERYRRAGVNVGLGTDVAPQDIIQEMRWAMILARTVERDGEACPSLEMLNHVTVNGAKALGRDDLGRLAPGCKADLLVFDLRAPELAPVRDPIRALMYLLDGRDVRAAMVDGRVVLRDGRVLNVDEEELRREAQRAAELVWERVPAIADGRCVEEIVPALLPRFGESGRASSSRCVPSPAG